LERWLNSYLKLYDGDCLPYPDWQDIGLYDKLSHPRLADQIRPYIRDIDKSVESRVVAIRIAAACKEYSLQDDLVKIALDQSQPLEVREEAADAISIIGEGKAKERLKPLAVSEVGDDPDDEMKACALMALWPDYISAKELFSIITPPKRENYVGTYQRFLSNVTGHIKSQDILNALEWVETKGILSDSMSSFAYLSDEIMLKAWNNLDYPGVLNAFANVIISRLNHYGQVMSDYHDSKLRDAHENDENRHRILEAIVPLLPELGETKTYLLFHSDIPLASSKDLYWMIECLQKSDAEQIQCYWAELIDHAFDRSDTKQLDSILVACEKNKILAEQFTWLIEPIELASPKAKKIKERYLERQELLKKINNRPLLDPPPSERIALLLDECESGNNLAWWNLNRVMTLKPDSTHYGTILESDLTSLPGWEEADAPTKSRIVEAAKRYLLEADTTTTNWLDKDKLYWPELASYSAFRLILQENPNYISAIPEKIWKKWVSIIIAYPTSNGTESDKTQKELVKIAYQYAPEEIIKSLIILIDKENKEHDHIFVRYKVENCWDEKLADALLNKAKDKRLKPKCMGDLLSQLLDHNFREAKTFAESLVMSYKKSHNKKFSCFNFIGSPIFQCFNEFWNMIIEENEEISRAEIAASALMSHANDAGWSVVWPAMG